MTNRVPDWVTPVAWTYLALCLLSAVYLAVEIYGRGRRHRTVADELVWLTSALYLGPAAVLLHRRRDRSAVVDGLPGGAASALAHVVGVPLVVSSGLTIAGIDLWVMILVIGVVAVVLLFTYALAAHTGRRPSVGAAAGAAVLTVLAFDVGMGGWMLLLHFNELMPPATDSSFWLLMQVGVVLGLLTGAPVVAWLRRRDALASPA